MSVASWRPGTARWAWLNTGVYLVALVVGLPLAIAGHTESGWVLFSVVMLAGVCNTVGAPATVPPRETAPVPGHGRCGGGNKRQVAPSAPRSARRSVNTWLDQRRPWPYALIMALVVGAAAAVTSIVIGWLWRGQLNPGAIVGTVAGTMTGCFVVALGVRLTRAHQR